ncbi:TPA: hypothetical protein N0F65_012418 [Lagenidium giganteum]|uniref:O-phosphoseryl-tRNA(Sec) selenium transferase n=1 Tax=Lagenidium giganteum TaxID=4803 RepID=A0AAV2YPW6_9STRA|nr:TPA: hypothetical protein N0F65_012418 [Lagenidium giganteum]
MSLSEDQQRLVASLVPSTYVQQGVDALRNRSQLVTSLLAQRRLPDDGWDDLSVELLLQTLAGMDSNNFRTNLGAGEREARVFSPMVARRHFYLCHGVGRSGDVAAVQPKAAGSSLIVQLSNALARDLLVEAGMRSVSSALVLPVATGMSLTLVLLSLREQRPHAKYVIWPRIDQKSCFKSIVTAGFTPLVLPNAIQEGTDELQTDTIKLREWIEEHGSESIAAVMTTTSCFAPRGYDQLEAVGQICRELDVPHVVNNAYGVQSSKCMHVIEQAMRHGRVDAVVQSLDKNFMVPVGGAIVCSSSKAVVERVAKLYPGRASVTPTLDFFITMLQMGRNGYKDLLKQRKQLAKYMKTKLEELAEEFGERVLRVPHNEISFAMTLSTLFGNDDAAADNTKALTFFGAMLFSRGVSGTRVVSGRDKKVIAGHEFESFGAHYDGYPDPYITCACAIGMTPQEVDAVIDKLRKTMAEWKKKQQKQKRAQQQQQSEMEATMKEA